MSIDIDTTNPNPPSNPEAGLKIGTFQGRVVIAIGNDDRPVLTFLPEQAMQLAWSLQKHATNLLLGRKMVTEVLDDVNPAQPPSN